tara:strand:- start:50629 stop:51003 length:375 start_codon:yes stop_codon:yes gene_type:complete
MKMVRTQRATLLTKVEELKTLCVKLREQKVEQEARELISKREAPARGMGRLRMLNRTAAEKLEEAVLSVARSTLPGAEKDEILANFEAVVGEARQWERDLQDFHRGGCGGYRSRGPMWTVVGST